MSEYFVNFLITFKESLRPGDMKNKALKFVQRGNLHQVLRKEILFGLIPKTMSAGLDQQHELGHLMSVLGNCGFLTDVKGLWRLQTIKKFSKIMNVPNGLPFAVKQENIDVFCRNSNDIEI